MNSVQELRKTSKDGAADFWRPGSGSNMRRRYERIRVLGSGSFGQAWLVNSRASGKQYVIKEIRLPSTLVSSAGVPSSATRKEQEQFFNEISIIRSCSHVNIIRYKECFIVSEDSVNNTPINDMAHSSPRRTEKEKPVMAGPPAYHIACIVMEYADAGDLQDHIRHYRDVNKTHIEESIIRNWFVQICFALEYLHTKGILHRDLKTQNIFLTSRRLVKLGDFGISRTLAHAGDYATTSIGTPQYLSPEICQQRKYDFKSDIWGLGCVLYEMCSLCHAFPGNDLPQLIHKIVRGEYKPIPNVYGSHIGELVKVMLRPNPSRRPTVKQVLNAKVLRDDVLAYMGQIHSLPEMQNEQQRQHAVENVEKVSEDGAYTTANHLINSHRKGSEVSADLTSGSAGSSNCATSTDEYTSTR